MIHSSVNYLHDHPFIGFIVSVVMYVTGTQLGDPGNHHLLIQVDSSVITEPTIPIIVIQMFQIFAFTGAGITGLVAGHGWIKKNFGKNKSNDSKSE